jgi:hypothetical protein
MELNGWSSPQMLRRYGASAPSARARRTYDRIMTDRPCTSHDPVTESPHRATARDRRAPRHPASNLSRGAVPCVLLTCRRPGVSLRVDEGASLCPVGR